MQIIRCGLAVIGDTPSITVCAVVKDGSFRLAIPQKGRGDPEHFDCPPREFRFAHLTSPIR
jgi:hypothetical protein